MPSVNIKKESDNTNVTSQSGDDNNAINKHQKSRERRKELRRKRRVLESVFEKLKYDAASLSTSEIDDGINYFIELNGSQSRHTKSDVYFHITLDRLRQELMKQNHSKAAILEALRWYIESHKQDLRRLIRKTLMLGQPLFEHNNCTSNCKDFVDYSFFQTLPCIETINVLHNMAHPKVKEEKQSQLQDKDIHVHVNNKNNDNTESVDSDSKHSSTNSTNSTKSSLIDEIKTTDDFCRNLSTMTIEELYEMKEKYCIPIDKHYKHYCGEINQDIEGSRVSNESIVKEYLNKMEIDRFSDQWYNEYKHKSSYKNYEKMLQSGRGNKSKPLEQMVKTFQPQHRLYAGANSSLTAIFGSNEYNGHNNNHGNDYHSNNNGNNTSLNEIGNLRDSLDGATNRRKETVGVDIDIAKVIENQDHQKQCFNEYLNTNSYQMSLYERYMLDGNRSDRAIFEKEHNLVSRLSRQCKLENDKDSKQLLTPTRTRRRNNRKQYKSSKTSTFEMETNFKTKVSHEIHTRVKDFHKQITDFGILKTSKTQTRMDINFIENVNDNDEFANVMNAIKKDLRLNLNCINVDTNHIESQLQLKATNYKNTSNSVDSTNSMMSSMSMTTNTSDGTKYNPIELTDNNDYDNTYHHDHNNRKHKSKSKSKSKSKRKHKQKRNRNRKYIVLDNADANDDIVNDDTRLFLDQHTIYSYDKNNPLFAKITALHPYVHVFVSAVICICF